VMPSATWLLRAALAGEVQSALATRAHASMSMLQPECPRQQMPTFDSNSMLAVVLTGQSFRQGGQHSTGTSADVSEQEEALRSVQQHVLDPAQRQGWNLFVAIDTFADMQAMESDKAVAAQRALCEFGAHDMQISPTPRGAKLPGSLLLTFERLAKHPWAAMLMLRIDLVLKVPLTLPSPGDQGPVRVPFATSCNPGCAPDEMTHGGPRLAPAALPRVADTFFFVPRTRAVEWSRALAAHRDCSRGDLHNLLFYLADVNYLAPLSNITRRFDADSAKNFNPIYRITGRPEAADESFACWGCYSQQTMDQELAPCAGGLLAADALADARAAAANAAAPDAAALSAAAAARL